MREFSEFSAFVFLCVVIVAAVVYSTQVAYLKKRGVSQLSDDEPFDATPAPKETKTRKTPKTPKKTPKKRTT